MNNFYPLSLNLKNKPCIVVGGGNVATRRVRKLLDCGAVVTVISPTLNVELENLLKAAPSSSWLKNYYPGKVALEKACLVFAATNNPAINKEIHSDATDLGIFVNVASQGNISDFIIPSSFNQGDLQVSVSTSGKVPGLSKSLKETLEDTLGPEYASLINILEKVRSLVINDLENKDENLYTFSKITSNYHLILKDIKSGKDPNSIYSELIHNSGFKH